MVFYPRFFDYFHDAFEEFFAARYGKPYRDVLAGDGVGFPVVHLEGDFRVPLRYGDDIYIEIAVAGTTERSATFRYRIGRMGEPPAAEARVTTACMDMKTRRAVPIPPALRACFAENAA